MDDVQVIGDTIEYKGQPIAKFIKLPHVPESVRAAFVDELYEHIDTEDEKEQKELSLQQDLENKFFKKLKEALEDMNKDPISLDDMKELVEELETEVTCG